MSDLSKEDAQRIAQQVFPPLVRALELEVEQVGAGEVVVRMPISAHVARPDKVVSGQAICALADTAMVLATASAFGEFRPVATVDMHVSFQGALRDADAIAVARVEKIGSSLAFASVTISSAQERNKIAARASATFAVPRNGASKETGV